MSTVTYTRQLGFFDPAEHSSAAVSVIGLGGIGSFAAVSLAKLGVPSLTLMDFDEVEAHNVPNQFYSTDAIGLAKAEAIGATCRDFGGIEPNVLVGKMGADGLDAWQPTEVVISGLDSMAARSDVWSNVKMNPRIKMYLDARIAGQLIVIYAVNPMNIDDLDAYERTLHSDDEALPAACTERGVIDVGMVVGGLLTRLVRAHFGDDDVEPVTVMNMASLTLNRGGWVL